MCFKTWTRKTIDMFMIIFILIFGRSQEADTRESLENRFFELNKHTDEKLAEMEISFQERINSAEAFYKLELAKIEKRLSESEKGQKFMEMFYKLELAKIEKRFSESEKRQRSVEIFYKQELAEKGNWFSENEKRQKSIEMFYKQKLAEKENWFSENEKRQKSIETFYKRKLAKIANRFSESERRQKFIESFCDKKLAEVVNKYNNAEENRHITKHLEEIIISKVEKKLNNIEKRLDETVDIFENKLNELGNNRLFHIAEKPYPDQKSSGNVLTKIEQRRYDIAGRKTIANIKDIASKSNSGVLHSAEVHKVNVSTPGIVRNTFDGSDVVALNGEDRKSDKTVSTSLKRRLTPPGNNRVAFSAYLSAHATELGKEHPIPFDRVLLNEGQAFDTVLHAFICPINGIYMFQSALLSMQNSYIQTEIVKDGVRLAIIYAAGASGSNGYDQGFNSAIIQCNQGERVWVRVHAHDGTSLVADKYTTFSGYLLWEI